MTARRDKRAFSDIEYEMFGFEHAELGARIAEEWRFPTPICEAILCQHQPTRARVERALAEAVHCGDWLAAHAQQGLVPFDHPQWPDRRAADHFGLSPVALEDLIGEVRQGAASWAIAA